MAQKLALPIDTDILRMKIQKDLEARHRIEVEEKIGENVPPLVQCLYLNCLLLVYPIFYYSKLAINEGPKWFSKAGNYIHILHISLGYFNVFCQFRLGTHSLISKITLILVVLIILIKCFFFMRIVKSWSYIVTML